MKKAKSKIPEPEIRKEYDFSNGVRGKYAGRYALGTNVRLLDPDVAEIFKDSNAVNRSLRAIAGIIPKKRSPSSRAMLVREKAPKKYGE